MRTDAARILHGTSDRVRRCDRHIGIGEKDGSCGFHQRKFAEALAFEFPRQRTRRIDAVEDFIGLSRPAQIVDQSRAIDNRFGVWQDDH